MKKSENSNSKSNFPIGDWVYWKEDSYRKKYVLEILNFNDTERSYEVKNVESNEIHKLGLNSLTSIELNSTILQALDFVKSNHNVDNQKENEENNEKFYYRKDRAFQVVKLPSVAYEDGTFIFFKSEFDIEERCIESEQIKKGITNMSNHKEGFQSEKLYYLSDINFMRRAMSNYITDAEWLEALKNFNKKK